MDRPIIIKTIDDVKTQSTEQLYAKRAVLEMVINTAISEDRNDWEQTFTDNRISVKEQLDIINNELSFRNTAEPVQISCTSGTFNTQTAKQDRK